MSVCLAAAATFASAAGTSRSQAEEPAVLEGAIVTLIEEVEVPSRAQGPLAEWRVREGDLVEKGQVLAKVDDAEAALAVERAEAETTIARREARNDLPIMAAAKAADAAQAELKRAVESTTKYEKSVSESELDRLKLAAEEADLKRRQEEHVRQSAELTAVVKENELRAAQRKLDLHRVTAPIDGVVVEIKRRLGEWVEPGVPVVRLVRMDRLRVEAFCNVADLTPGTAGRPIEFRVATTGDAAPTYRGQITFVHPEVDPVNGQVRVWAEVENRDGALRPGMHGTITLPPASAVGGAEGAASQQ